MHFINFLILIGFIALALMIGTSTHQYLEIQKLGRDETTLTYQTCMDKVKTYANTHTHPQRGES